jgi:uncharacterized BrkB/YihY/UPF0761 family membrane protein
METRVIAPNAETPFVWITPGALLATAFWLLISFGSKVYVENFSNYAAVQGTIASSSCFSSSARTGDR